MSTLSYEVVAEPTGEIWELVGRGLGAFNVGKAGDEGHSRVCVVARDDDDALVGGAIGDVNWSWFNLSLMFIKEEYRDRGIGRALLSRAEAHARQNGARYAFLDTFDFQALGFYRKNGYVEFGRLDDFPGEHSRHFMKKDL